MKTACQSETFSFCVVFLPQLVLENDLPFAIEEVNKRRDSYHDTNERE